MNITQAVYPEHRGKMHIDTGAGKTLCNRDINTWWVRKDGELQSVDCIRCKKMHEDKTLSEDFSKWGSYSPIMKIISFLGRGGISIRKISKIRSILRPAMINEKDLRVTFKWLSRDAGWEDMDSGLVQAIAAKNHDLIACMESAPKKISEKLIISLCWDINRAFYGNYIKNSPEWKFKAEATKWFYGYKCALCNSGSNLHTHHRTYDRLGDEIPSDLVCLCSDCHANYHGVHSYHD